MVASGMQDRVDDIVTAWSSVRPELDPSPMGIVGRLSRAARLIERRMDADYRQHDLSAAEFDVLATLRRSGEPYRLLPTDLYRETMLSSGAMTARLDKLEARGLVARGPNPEDRRSVTVTLTEAGLQVVDRAMDTHLACEDQLINALSGAQRSALEGLLRTLLVSLGDRSRETE